MDIRARTLGQIILLELSGRLTINDKPGALKDAVAAAVAAGHREILLDLSGVKYIDSTRLGELIASHITVGRQGGRLKLVGTPPRILELLTMAGLEDVFEQFGTVDDAKDG